MTVMSLNLYLCLLRPPIIYKLSPMFWIYPIRTIWIPVQDVSVWRKILFLYMVPMIFPQLCTFFNAHRFVLIWTRFQVALQNKYNKKLFINLLDK